MPPYASIQQSLEGLKPGSRVMLKPAHSWLSLQHIWLTPVASVMRIKQTELSQGPCTLGRESYDVCMQSARPASNSAGNQTYSTNAQGPVPPYPYSNVGFDPSCCMSALCTKNKGILVPSLLSANTCV